MKRTFNKAWCMFEQSGTFKNEFIKLGIPAVDLDIQNNFGETDYVIDLFAEIDKEYAILQREREREDTIFSQIGQDDIVMAFFPCIYFCQMSQYMQSLNSVNYRHLTTDEALIKIMERQENRQRFLTLLTKFVYICIRLNIKMIFENPITDSFLNHYFLKSPDVKDMNRMKRGDYFNKPTGYWFWNFEPSYGESFQNDKMHKTISKSKPSGQAGLCSEDRSMISPDYARNFLCDFVLGEVQEGGQPSLFE